MGFDLSITLNLRIDPKTGLPYIWGKNFEHIPYVPSEHQVPEKYRDWVQQRGHHFHIYIQKFDKDGQNSTDVEEFLHEYPPWLTVKKSIGNNWEYEDWTEEVHNDFKEALEWFAAKHLNFTVCWSY